MATLEQLKHNFGAGPCILPQSVFEKAAQAVKNYDNTGLSILEISHRSKEFIAVMERAEQALKDLYNVGDEYQAMYLHGGASLQFAMVASNFLNNKAAYVNTGTWSKKALKEAQKLGQVDIIASSEEDNFNYIPSFDTQTEHDYVHLTSNNTIFGTQYGELPKTKSPLIVDMSSDFLSKEIDMSSVDLAYGGLQKNIGPAGAAAVLIKKDFLEQAREDMLSMLSYKIHAKNSSMFNTPPVFSIYTALLNMEWLKEQGGIAAIEQQNQAKAELLYHEIDSNPLLYGTAKVDSRSNMNVCFRMHDEVLETKFNTLCQEKGIVGIKGHRSVGGFRASMYNALPLSSVEYLVDIIQQFSKNI